MLVFYKYGDFRQGLKELITEYTTIAKNLLNSGTENPEIDEETREYFKNKSREFTKLIQKKLPKRYRIIPDAEWVNFL